MFIVGGRADLDLVDRLSSELLGFAPDARVLIVDCDDFGMHDAVNAAVVESIENGIAGSCSLLVPCPAAANVMRLLRQRPHIPFGIHLALIRDSSEYRWGPAAAKADVPSLLDPGTDELYINAPAAARLFLAKAKLTEVDAAARDRSTRWSTKDWHPRTSTGTALPTAAATTSSTWRWRSPRSTALPHGSGSTTAAAKLASMSTESSTTPSWTASPSVSTTRQRATRDCSATYRQASTMGSPPSARQRTMADDRALRLADPAKRPCVPHLSTSARPPR